MRIECDAEERKSEMGNCVLSVLPAPSTAQNVGTMDGATTDGAGFKRRRTSSSSSRPAQPNRPDDSPDRILSTKAKGKGKLAGFDDDEEEDEIERGERVVDVNPELRMESGMEDACAICLAPVVNRVRCSPTRYSAWS